MRVRVRAGVRFRFVFEPLMTTGIRVRFRVETTVADMVGVREFMDKCCSVLGFH